MAKMPDQSKTFAKLVSDESTLDDKVQYMDEIHAVLKDTPKLNLMPQQAEVAKYVNLYLPKPFLQFHVMGSGKTVTAISSAVLWCLRRKDPVKAADRVFVSAPQALAEAAVNNFYTDLTQKWHYVCPYVRSEERLQELDNSEKKFNDTVGKVFEKLATRFQTRQGGVVAHEKFKDELGKVLESSTEPFYLICDECQKIFNRSAEGKEESKLNIAWAGVVSKAINSHPENVVHFLTGTPVQNSIWEVFGILNVKTVTKAEADVRSHLDMKEMKQDINEWLQNFLQGSVQENDKSAKKFLNFMLTMIMGRVSVYDMIKNVPEATYHYKTLEMTPTQQMLNSFGRCQQIINSVKDKDSKKLTEGFSQTSSIMSISTNQKWHDVNTSNVRDDNIRKNLGLGRELKTEDQKRALVKETSIKMHHLLSEHIPSKDASRKKNGKDKRLTLAYTGYVDIGLDEIMEAYESEWRLIEQTDAQRWRVRSARKDSKGMWGWINDVDAFVKQNPHIKFYMTYFAGSSSSNLTNSNNPSLFHKYNIRLIIAGQKVETGFSLFSCDDVVLLSPTWTMSSLEQIEFRCRRTGMDVEVPHIDVTYLIATANDSITESTFKDDLRKLLSKVDDNEYLITQVMNTVVEKDKRGGNIDKEKYVTTIRKKMAHTIFRQISGVSTVPINASPSKEEITDALSWDIISKQQMETLRTITRGSKVFDLKNENRFLVNESTLKLDRSLKSRSGRKTASTWFNVKPNMRRFSSVSLTDGIWYHIDNRSMMYINVPSEELIRNRFQPNKKMAVGPIIFRDLMFNDFYAYKSQEKKKKVVITNKIDSSLDKWHAGYFASSVNQSLITGSVLLDTDEKDESGYRGMIVDEFSHVVGNMQCGTWACRSVVLDNQVNVYRTHAWIIQTPNKVLEEVNQHMINQQYDQKLKEWTIVGSPLAKSHELNKEMRRAITSADKRLSNAKISKMFKEKALYTKPKKHADTFIEKHDHFFVDMISDAEGSSIECDFVSKIALENVDQSYLKGANNGKLPPTKYTLHGIKVWAVRSCNVLHELDYANMPMGKPALPFKVKEILDRHLLIERTGAESDSGADIKLLEQSDELQITEESSYDLTENDKLYVKQFIKDQNLPKHSRNVRTVLPKVDNIDFIPMVSRMQRWNSSVDRAGHFTGLALQLANVEDLMEDLHAAYDYKLKKKHDKLLKAQRDSALSVLSMYPCVFEEAIGASLYQNLPKGFEIISFLTNHVTVYVNIDKQHKSFALPKGGPKIDFQLNSDGEVVEEYSENNKNIELISNFVQTKVGNNFRVKFYKNISGVYYDQFEKRNRQNKMVWSISRK